MKKYKELTEDQKKSVVKKFDMLLEYSFITKQDDLLLDEDEDLEQQSDSISTGIEPVDINANIQPDQSLDISLEPDRTPNIQSDPIQTEIPVTPEVAETEIDVTQLTNDQKQVDDKVNQLTNQTSEIMNLLATITDKMDSISNKIELDNNSIRKEIEERNPTPKEILQKRQTLGDPFNITPEQFWHNKQAEGGYELKDNEKTFEIRPADLDDNTTNVYKSFGLKDNETSQSLRSIMGY